MSKMVCEICGTTYDEASGVCPVCGWKPGDNLDTTGDMDDFLNEDFQLDDLDDGASPASAQKGKAVFDYDAVNTRRRQAPKPKPDPTPEAEEDDEEEEESGSNKFLVFILVVLILALLAVSGYIAYTKLWKPDKMGSDSNKPQETIATETMGGIDSTAPTGELAVTENTGATQSTEATEPTVPCTGLSLVGNMDTLTYAGQYWRLMVKYTPENTTDKVTYTSGDESVVTVDEYGRVTAVGEGETDIVIQCGEKRIQTHAVVNYGTTETQAAPTEGTSGTGTTGSGSTVATPSNGAVLKLKKTDITLFRRGVYFTLELENGISADSVSWSTSDSSIANVYNGKVTSMNPGVCVIKAEYNGQVAECVVRCKF